jgi:carboxypeptidase C (cathepsin A)
MRGKPFWVLVFIFLFIAIAGRATDDETTHTAYPEENAVTQHRVEIGGETIAYTATAGTIPLTDEEGKPLAQVFFIGYAKDGVEDVSKRPLLFSFNGGPGSASAWMHIGLLGPQKVRLDEEGRRLPPPYKLVENPHSMIDITDMVFIDPVSTGYSRAMPGVDRKQFHGFREDIDAVGDFIRLYITQHNRWDSPKFLIGESYGSRRAAGLASHLQGRLGIDLNGIILVSAGSMGEQYGNFGMLEYALNLPHFAATAWYHKKIASDLGAKPLHEVLDEVEAFALEDYALALLKGNRLTDDERKDMVRRLSRYTGLSESYIDSAHLRITRRRFRKELLRDENRTVGRLDSRFTGIDSDEAGERTEFDPSMANIRGTFTATINSYVRNELGYETDLDYRISANVRPWNPAPDLNLLEELRSAMAQNPHLQVLVADGIYDKLYFWPTFTFAQFDFNPELRSRVKIAKYESGHMMYIHGPSLVKMKDDMAAFVRSAVSQ